MPFWYRTEFDLFFSLIFLNLFKKSFKSCHQNIFNVHSTCLIFSKDENKWITIWTKRWIYSGDFYKIWIEICDHSKFSSIKLRPLVSLYGHTYFSCKIPLMQTVVVIIIQLQKLSISGPAHIENHYIICCIYSIILRMPLHNIKIQWFKVLENPHFTQFRKKRYSFRSKFP